MSEVSWLVSAPAISRESRELEVVTVSVMIRVSVLNPTSDEANTTAGETCAAAATCCSARGCSRSWLYVAVSACEARRVSTSEDTGPTSKLVALTYWGGAERATNPATMATRMAEMAINGARRRTLL